MSKPLSIIGLGMVLILAAGCTQSPGSGTNGSGERSSSSVPSSEAFSTIPKTVPRLLFSVPYHAYQADMTNDEENALRKAGKLMDVDMPLQFIALPDTHFVISWPWSNVYSGSGNFLGNGKINGDHQVEWNGTVVQVNVDTVKDGVTFSTPGEIHIRYPDKPTMRTITGLPTDLLLGELGSGEIPNGYFWQDRNGDLMLSMYGEKQPTGFISKNSADSVFHTDVSAKNSLRFTAESISSIHVFMNGKHIDDVSPEDDTQGLKAHILRELSDGTSVVGFSIGAGNNYFQIRLYDKAGNTNSVITPDLTDIPGEGTERVWAISSRGGVFLAVIRPGDMPSTTGGTVEVYEIPNR